MSKNFIKEIGVALKSGFKLSIIRKLNRTELSLILWTLLYPAILLLDSSLIYALNIAVVISLVLSMKYNYSEKPPYRSLGRNITITSAIIVQVSSLISLYIFYRDTNVEWSNFFELITGVVGIFAFLFVLSGFIMSILNLLFYVGLKIIFPKDNGETVVHPNIKLKDLSPYMNLQQQIAYFILSILNFLIHITVAIYVIGFVPLTIEEYNDITFFAEFRNWYKEIQAGSLSIILSLISVIMGVLSISFRAQMKIYNEAYQVYKEDRKI